MATGCAVAWAEVVCEEPRVVSVGLTPSQGAHLPAHAPGSPCLGPDPRQAPSPGSAVVTPQVPGGHPQTCSDSAWMATLRKLFPKAARGTAARPAPPTLGLAVVRSALARLWGPLCAVISLSRRNGQALVPNTPADGAVIR